VVGIRLVNASAGDLAAVDRQLGPIRSSLGRSPDLVIRFVERLTGKQSLRLLGVDDAAFTEDAFLLLRGKHKSTARVQIPFDQIGSPCEIVCESGMTAVPLLIPIINLTALAKGVLPLHASAFVYRGIGVVATGWSKGGKTELLLALMAEGAKYVGDEWVYLSPEGDRVFGIPEPVTVWDWHLRQMPQLRSAVSRKTRVRLRGLGLAVAALERVARGGKKSERAKSAARLAAALKRQGFVNLPPQTLFGPKACVGAASFDKLVFVASHDRPDVVVERISPLKVAQRMVFSLQEERMPLLSYYHKFRFAFPERSNRFLESAEGLQRDLLHRALQRKDSYALYHPYPASLQGMRDAMLPLLENSSRDAAWKHDLPQSWEDDAPAVAADDLSFTSACVTANAVDPGLHEMLSEKEPA
jgi:hypothetical protein